MRITESMLRRIIREELLREEDAEFTPTGETARGRFLAAVKENFGLANITAEEAVADALQHFLEGSERIGIGNLTEKNLTEDGLKFFRHLKDGAPIFELEPGDVIELKDGVQGVVQKWHGIAKLLYFFDGRELKWIAADRFMPKVKLITRAAAAVPITVSKPIEYIPKR